MARPSVTLKQLCARHGVDAKHAQHVAEMSLALFDALADVHQLAATRRKLLRAAAILHNIAFASDPARHHTAGRDMILAESLRGYSAEERNMLACTTRFHRKKVAPKKEPVYQALPRARQKETLALAALLRVGDALDYSGTQSSRILSFERRDGAVTVIVEGANAPEEAARANVKADLWNKIFTTRLRVADRETAQALQERARRAPEAGRACPMTPGVAVGDSMAVAGRKVLLFHYERLLEHEPRTRKGRDMEALHQMRVASRRLRAAVRLFGDYLPGRILRRLRKGLREFTRALGPVRDLDVHIQKAQRYRKSLPAGQRETLAPLLEHWRAARYLTRQKMLGYLDGRPFTALKATLEDLARADLTMGARAKGRRANATGPRQDRVCEVAPALIWQHYEAVRAYETRLEGAPIETLHALRIDCKRLRYALELLREVLGPPGERAIEIAKQAQDHLGELHDADVAIGLLRTFLENWSRDTGNADGPPTGVQAAADYLAACGQDLNEHVAAFPALWEQLASPAFRRLLGEATATP